jgi:hypothetical protein
MVGQAETLTVSAEEPALSADIAGRASRSLVERAIGFVKAPPLGARYIIVSGVIGVPLSIATLQAMVFIYKYFSGGDIGRIPLNGLWLLNFEIGLTRNFLGFCFYTWRTKPTRRQFQHIHVAAIGALVIDIVAFNVVYHVTGVLLIAQVFGASSGFFLNFAYNNLLTFAGVRHHAVIDDEVVI